MDRLESHSQEQSNAHKNNIRTTPFYFCSADSSHSQEKNTSIIYQLTSIANPRLSLYEIFTTYSLPTTSTITQQMVQFLVKSVKAYRQRKVLHELAGDFFPSCIKETVKRDIERELEILMEMGDQELQKINYQQFQSAQCCLKRELRQLRQEVKYFLIGIMKQNLKKLTIVPTSRKMAKIERLTHKLSKNFEVELINKEKGILKEVIEGKITLILTLEELLNDDREIVVNKQQLSSYYFELFNQITKFCESSLNFYYSSDARAFWMAHPKNILVYIQKYDQHSLHLQEEMPFGLDLLSIFLTELGLGERPITYEQILAFNNTPKPPLNQFNFSEAVRKQSQSLSESQRKEIESVLSWIVVCQAISSRLVENKLVYYQMDNIDSFRVFQIIKNMEIGWLNPEIFLMLTLFKEGSIPQYVYKNWNKYISKFYGEKEQKYFKRHQFQSAQFILSSHVKLLTSQHLIKALIQKNKCLGKLNMVGKCVLKYILAKYGLIELQINCRMSGYVNQNIFHCSYKIKKQADQLKEVVLSEGTRIDGQEWIENNADLLQLYQRLEKYDFRPQEGNKNMNKTDVDQRIQSLQELKKESKLKFWGIIREQLNNNTDLKKQQNAEQTQFQIILEYQSIKRQHIQLCTLQILAKIYFSFTIQNYSQYQVLLLDIQEFLKQKQLNEEKVNKRLKEFRSRIKQ